MSTIRTSNMANPTRRDVFALAAATVGCRPAVGLSSTVESLSRRQGAMAGEPTATSIILQTRLTVAGIDPGVPMADGFVQFELWPEGQENKARMTEILRADPANDGIVKVFVERL